MLPTRPAPEPNPYDSALYQDRAASLFGFTPENIAVMFLHNLQSIGWPKGKKFVLPKAGEKHPQPCSLVRREIEHFLVLYPAARHWQKSDWEMFLHFNPVEPHPAGSVEHISRLMIRATTACLPVRGKRKRHTRPDTNPPQEATP